MKRLTPIIKPQEKDFSQILCKRLRFSRHDNFHTSIKVNQVLILSTFIILAYFYENTFTKIFLLG